MELDDAAQVGQNVSHAASASSGAVADYEDPRVEVFPEFADKSGWCGRLITGACIDNIAIGDWERMSLSCKRHMCSLNGDVLSQDFTFKVAGRVVVSDPVTHGRFKPYNGMSTVMNEIGQVLWYGFAMREEAFEELSWNLLNLKARLCEINDDPDYKPSVIYVDNCCHLRKKYESIWPGVVVKLDVFHWLARWDDAIARTPGHSDMVSFRARLRDAVLVPDDDDYSKAKAALTIQRAAAGKPKPMHAEILKHCRRVIPEPAELRKRLDRVVQTWCDHDANAVGGLVQEQRGVSKKTKSGRKSKAPGKMGSQVVQSLFWKPDWKKTYDKQMAHVDCGCLSDPPDLKLYFEKPGKRSLPLWFTSRGSSQNEGMHRWLRAATAYFNDMGISRADCIIGRYFYEWNVDRGIEKCGDIDYGTYYHTSLGLINSMLRSLSDAQPLQFPHLDIPQRDESRETTGFLDGNLGAKPSPVNVNDIIYDNEDNIYFVITAIKWVGAVAVLWVYYKEIGYPESIVPEPDAEEHGTPYVSTAKVDGFERWSRSIIRGGKQVSGSNVSPSSQYLPGNAGFDDDIIKVATDGRCGIRGICDGANINIHPDSGPRVDMRFSDSEACHLLLRDVRISAAKAMHEYVAEQQAKIDREETSVAERSVLLDEVAILLARIDEGPVQGDIDAWLATMLVFDVNQKNTSVWMDGLLMMAIARDQGVTLSLDRDGEIELVHDAGDDSPRVMLVKSPNHFDRRRGPGDVTDLAPGVLPLEAAA